MLKNLLRRPRTELPPEKITRPMEETEDGSPPAGRETKGAVLRSAKVTVTGKATIPTYCTGVILMMRPCRWNR